MPGRVLPQWKLDEIQEWLGAHADASAEALAQQFHLKRSTASCLKKKYCDSGMLRHSPRPGRPVKSKGLLTLHLEKILKEDPTLTLRGVRVVRDACYR